MIVGLKKRADSKIIYDLGFVEWEQISTVTRVTIVTDYINSAYNSKDDRTVTYGYRMIRSFNKHVGRKRKWGGNEPTNVFYAKIDDKKYIKICDSNPKQCQNSECGHKFKCLTASIQC